MGSRPTISVLINTLNEEHNIANAIRSVKSWTDEVVVVDMHSDDQTVAIAQSLGARVFQHERLGYVEPARAFGAAQCTGDYLLILDADEMIEKALADRILQIVAGDEADLVRLPYETYMLGGRMDTTSYAPQSSAQTRLFKRGIVHFSDKIHGGVHVDSGRYLEVPYQEGANLVHFSTTDFNYLVDKLNRYTNFEALGAKPVTPMSALLQYTRIFFRNYVGKKGYRDGWRGFAVSLYCTMYRMAIHAKRMQLDGVGDRDAILRRYQDRADEVLKGY